MPIASVVVNGEKDFVIDLGSGDGVIVLTARRDEVDRIRGLTLGADDYLAKPVRRLELLARVNALGSRSTLATSTQHFIYAAFVY